MNHDDRSLDRAARSWLELGPRQAPNQALEAALARIQTTPQERGLALPWRLPTMFTNRVAVAALAIVLLVAGGGIVLTRLTSTGGVGGPAPTSRPSQSPSHTAASSPAPSPTPLPTIATSDVGRLLPPGTYRVTGFAAPFTITLPTGWTANELTPTSATIADASDASVNVYMAVVDKVYADPCKTAGGPRPVAPSVDALVTALSRVAHIRLTALANATIGGARGKTFRFGGASTLQTLNCGSMLKFATHVENGKDIDIAIFPGETDQFWAVDAAGTTVLIAITDNKVAAVQPVLNSVSFVASPG